MCKWEISSFLSADYFIYPNFAEVAEEPSDELQNVGKSTYPPPHQQLMASTYSRPPTGRRLSVASRHDLSRILSDLAILRVGK